MFEIEELHKKCEVQKIEELNIKILNVVCIPATGKDMILKFLSRADTLSLSMFLVKQFQAQNLREMNELREKLETRIHLKMKKIENYKNNKKTLPVSNFYARELIQQKIAKIRHKINIVRQDFLKEHKLPSTDVGEKGWLYDEKGEPQTKPLWVYHFVDKINDLEWRELIDKCQDLIVEKEWLAPDLEKMRQSPVKLCFAFGEKIEEWIKALPNRKLLEDYGSDKTGTGAHRSLFGHFSVHGIDGFLASELPENAAVSTQERTQLAYIIDLIGIYFAFYLCETALCKLKTELAKTPLAMDLNAALSTPRNTFTDNSYLHTPRSMQSPRFDQALMTPRKMDRFTQQIDILLEHPPTPREVSLEAVSKEDASTLTMIQNYLLYMEGCEGIVNNFGKKMESFTANSSLMSLDGDLQRIIAVSRIQTSSIRKLLEDVLKNQAHLADALSLLLPPD